MTEILHGIPFRVSPQAFFQTNSACAERLYELTSRFAEVTAGDLLLDVCCGTGTIGLYMHKQEPLMHGLIGIDISSPAIIDARKNAESIGVTGERVAFIDSPAEAVLNKVLAADAGLDLPPDMGTALQERLSAGKGIVAVVDPPRGGLHPAVLKALRACSAVQRLVYVSCAPTKSFVDDCISLCAPRTKKMVSHPFFPLRSQPVDMFPTTPHVELVTVFQRAPPEADVRTSEGVTTTDERLHPRIP
jgi:tRNA/tmRNA/rRNA uracil-C5-methylase (TrmA/RlmC/RlmD family)